MYLYALLAMLFVTGCATTPKQTASFKSAYVATSNTLGHTGKAIEANLTRSKQNSMLSEIAAAYPYSGAIIESSLKERGAKNLDNSEKVSKDIEQYKKFFLTDKSCFAIRLTTFGAIESAMFKNWVSKVEQPVGTYHEATFTNITGVESVPEIFTTTGIGTTWFNNSFVCTKYKIDYTKEFSLNLIPQLGDGGPLKLTWKPEITPAK